MTQNLPKPSEIIKARAKELGSDTIETKDGRVVILGWQAGMEALLEYLDSLPPKP